MVYGGETDDDQHRRDGTGGHDRRQHHDLETACLQRRYAAEDRAHEGTRKRDQTGGLGLIGGRRADVPASPAMRPLQPTRRVAVIATTTSLTISAAATQSGYRMTAAGISQSSPHLPVAVSPDHAQRATHL